MKKVNYFVLLSILGLGVSCSKDDLTKKQDVPTGNSTVVLERIKSLGFDEKDIEEFDDYYVVEGDIQFPKSDTIVSDLKQARTNNLVAINTISVFLDNNFSTLNAPMQTALINAINIYNNTGMRLRLVLTTVRANANIIISRDNTIGTDVCGMGGFPTAAGMPFNLVRISETTLTAHRLTTNNHLVYLILHELGHNIGMRHTNWSANGETAGADGAILIANTPTSDASSIMNAGECGNTRTNFSTADLTALRTMYPKFSNMNLVVVGKAATGTKTTEVHIMDGGTLYQSFLVQTGTALHETNADWQFTEGDYNRDGVKDLIAIKRRNTGTNKTEVHVLNGANNYQSFILQIGTALGVTDDNWSFTCGDYNKDGFVDVIAIKKQITGTKKTEVHILNGANNFQSFLLQTGTVLPEITTKCEFMYGDYNNDGTKDIYAVLKNSTGTKKTEVHVLNGANNFQSYLLNIGTALHETGDTWSFTLGDINSDGKQDVIGISKSSTGTRRTEVHALNGANNFQSFVVQTGTILSETNANWEFIAR